MIAIRGLALAAVASASAIAFAPRAAAEPGLETFTINARYDTTRSALDNYLAFARQIERACRQHGVRGIDVRQQERDCARETMDRLVGRMDRAELSQIHDLRIGRPADSSRMLAVR
jgi:hypothetical protein